jgi:hypothetical protein
MVEIILSIIAIGISLITTVGTWIGIPYYTRKEIDRKFELRLKQTEITQTLKKTSDNPKEVSIVKFHRGRGQWVIRYLDSYYFQLELKKLNDKEANIEYNRLIKEEFKNTENIYMEKIVEYLGDISEKINDIPLS